MNVIDKKFPRTYLGQAFTRMPVSSVIGSTMSQSNHVKLLQQHLKKTWSMRRENPDELPQAYINFDMTMDRIA